ncbi:hypothetical protein BOTCAL_0004g00240 [Botryotinia calthae]|uniref:Uncharacterized protein n=1 Tax=Botryotinia calthae TaxID=38488 RepID=A0A4Y8DHJ7_9HELO|nr:hypothetical protein BOTCAL_0004g00240 [Botryotinia calthae]
MYQRPMSKNLLNVTKIFDQAICRPRKLLESPDFSHLILTSDSSFSPSSNALDFIPTSYISNNSDDQMQQKISSEFVLERFATTSTACTGSDSGC